MTELRFDLSNTTDTFKQLTGWHHKVADEAQANASSNSPIGAMSDMTIRRRGPNTLLIVITEDSGDLSIGTETAIINAVQNQYSEASHIETTDDVTPV